MKLNIPSKESTLATILLASMSSTDMEAGLCDLMLVRLYE